jgi:hypothetical protein
MRDDIWRTGNVMHVMKYVIGKCNESDDICNKNDRRFHESDGKCNESDGKMQ